MLPAVFCIVCMVAFTGCAGRKTATARTPSHPSESSPSEPPVKENSSSGIASSRVPKKGKIVSPPVTPGYTEEGSASWYGEPFHGRRASNGEIYDMYKLTAAHRTLPFETIVRVTNLNNGKSTTVRITDRGPFVSDRVIDLSKAAAQAVGISGVGRVTLTRL